MEDGSSTNYAFAMAEASPLYHIRLAVRRELIDIEAGEKIIVATSGGADSFALAAAILPEAESRSIIPIAVIVDHALQKNSADVALRARQELIKIGYSNVEIRKIQVEKSDGPEASARRAR